MADWTDEWHETAEKIIRAEFEHAYALGGGSNDDDQSVCDQFFVVSIDFHDIAGRQHITLCPTIFLTHYHPYQPLQRLLSPMS